MYDEINYDDGVICCRLYSDPKTRPRYNLLFVLSGGGNFNYFGTKALLDEQLDDPGTCMYMHKIMFSWVQFSWIDDLFVHNHTCTVQCAYFMGL